MSRSGRIPITIPENTEVKIDAGVFFAKGKLGELSFKFDNNAKVEIKENTVFVSKEEKVNILQRCGVLLGQESVI